MHDDFNLNYNLTINYYQAFSMQFAYAKIRIPQQICNKGFKIQTALAVFLF